MTSMLSTSFLSVCRSLASNSRRSLARGSNIHLLGDIVGGRRSLTSSSPCSSSSQPPPVAFAFDIDGVLKQGPKVLPQALTALQWLHGKNKYKVKVPYILVTNGGGVSEEARAKRLSEELQVNLSTNQILQAHTVLSSLTRYYADEPILVIGGPNRPPGNTRTIMNSYGFNNVFTVDDLHSYAPSAWPFSRVSAESLTAVREDADFSKIKFKAVIVFHDSRDWGRDIQFMTDILRSKQGVFGTLAEDQELKSREQIPMYFSHGDLLWGNDFPVSRFGQGAFRHAFSNVWQKTTGLPFEFTVFGKPERLTYDYAYDLLKSQLPHKDTHPKVYMVGDNPESDIKGGNDFKWETVLVRTGVYRDALGEPKYTPTMLVDDVQVAVAEALKREWGSDALDE
ncbi:unnamed protein product [Sympodiomycopsis kandeliae]